MTAGKRPWSAPLADFVARALDPLVAKQGFAGSNLLLHWDDIVGERLAAVCRPVRLAWPPRGPKRDPSAPLEPATLVVLTEGAFALELQHQAPLLIERVNAHLGWRCVHRLQIRQGRLAVATPREKPRRRPPPDPAQAEALAGNIGDEALRDAVARLGAAVLDQKKERGG